MSERLLILDLDVDIIILDSVDLVELKELLEDVHNVVDIENAANWDIELKWYGDDAIYYYYINNDGNIVLTDLIAR